MSGKAEINIPSPVAELLERIERRGGEAYIVGGCVRDSLLGKAPGDYDVTTSAEPAEMLEIFRDLRVIETGIRHGTVTVLSGDYAVEITTFRQDGKYSDNRRPDSVSFVRTLEEDLSRRDFTVNAMAYSEKTGLVDLFGGQNDLKAGVIRCVGEPDRRFSEDALRIMRALRFASSLAFELEEGTKRAVFERKELLRDIAAERFASELIKLLCGAGAGKIVREYIDVLGVWMPELPPMKGFKQNHPFHVYDVLSHTAKTLENIPPVPHMRLTALLHDCGKPYCRTTDKNGTDHFHGHPAKSAEIARVIFSRLRIDNFTAQRCAVLIENHDIRIQFDEKNARIWLAKLTPEVFFELLQMKRADIMAQNPEKLSRLEDIDGFEKIAREQLASGLCLSLKDLKLGGDELLKLGFKPGPEIGKALGTLLEKAVEGALKNEPQELIKYAKTLKTE